MNCQGLTGKVILPCDADYNRARQVYNEAINKCPLAICYCCDVQDIVNALLWSERQKVQVRIRSGGHNYEGYSVGTDKLVIDTSFMNDIKINSEDDTVEVQAGTRLMHLYETLYASRYTFPGGTCPTVAISGLVLGGGIGLSTRYLGLTTDNLIEAQMVDANGNLLTANNCHNENLFWALRGAGGGNFGVVTSYKFHLKKINKITLIQLRWDNKSARLEFLRVWQEWLRNLDPRISAFGRIYKPGPQLFGFFYGYPEEARQILEPLLSIPGISFENIEYVDFIDAVKIIGEIYPKREAFKSTGRFIERQLSECEMEKVIDIVEAAPTETNSFIGLYSLGGAVRDIKTDSTAFFYRQANYIMGITSSWEIEATAPIHKEWVVAGFKYIYTISVGSYVNFPYNNLPNYECAYYGEHVRELWRIKKEYDPHNVFEFPQSIKTVCCG
ncbi:MAG: Reticuline oxidase [Firmicutes bacterium]|nr:Reticuline oxidase [Bacillota bacterium]